MSAKSLARLPAVLFAVGLVSCVAVAPRVRRYTYPPDFKYIEREQVRSAMWQLAYSVRELDRTMRRDGPVDEAGRQRIAELLAAMEAATQELRTTGRPTNHPVVGTHLETFRRDLMLARRAVEAEEPNYFLVGAVSGSCLVCHGGAA